MACYYSLNAALSKPSPRPTMIHHFCVATLVSDAVRWHRPFSHYNSDVDPTSDAEALRFLVCWKADVNGTDAIIEAACLAAREKKIFSFVSCSLVWTTYMIKLINEYTPSPNSLLKKLSAWQAGSRDHGPSGISGETV
jgi:hypothetical protein